MIGAIEIQSESPCNAAFFKSQQYVGIHTKSPKTPITVARCVLQIAALRGDSRKRAKKCAHGRVQKGGVQANRKKTSQHYVGQSGATTAIAQPHFRNRRHSVGKRGERTTASRKTVETTRIPLYTAAFFLYGRTTFGTFPRGTGAERAVSFCGHCFFCTAVQKSCPVRAFVSPKRVEGDRLSATQSAAPRWFARGGREEPTRARQRVLPETSPWD